MLLRWDQLAHIRHARLVSDVINHSCTQLPGVHPPGVYTTYGQRPVNKEAHSKPVYSATHCQHGTAVCALHRLLVEGYVLAENAAHSGLNKRLLWL